MESIETVTITNPANPILIWWVIAQPLLLLLSFLVGRLTRFLLRGRVSVSGAAATLIALVGLWLGLLLAGWIFDEGDLFSFKMLATSCGVAVVVLVATSAVLARIQHRRTLLPIAEVAQMGESDRLEFKSSARWNLRTDKRDEAMEEVVAKTVAAFMNSAGGTLLLGVDDGGNLIGLGPDYATLKQPDADRFELWLRGMWRTRMGTNAAALPQVDFAPTPDGTAEVCRVTAPPVPAAGLPQAGQGSRRSGAVGAGRQLDAAPGGGRRGRLRHAALAADQPRGLADPAGELPAAPRPVAPGTAHQPGRGRHRRHGLPRRRGRGSVGRHRPWGTATQWSPRPEDQRRGAARHGTAVR